MLKTTRETTGKFAGITYVVPADTPVMEYMQGIFIVRHEEDIRTIMSEPVARPGAVLQVPAEDVADG